MKQSMLNKLKTGNVVVFMDFVNYLGEINESVELARFHNQAWADKFVKEIIAESLEQGIQYRVEVIQ